MSQHESHPDLSSEVVKSDIKRESVVRDVESLRALSEIKNARELLDKLEEQIKKGPKSLPLDSLRAIRIAVASIGEVIHDYFSENIE